MPGRINRIRTLNVALEFFDFIFLLLFRRGRPDGNLNDKTFFYAPPINSLDPIKSNQKVLETKNTLPEKCRQEHFMIEL